MKIVGIDGFENQRLAFELQNGAKLVVFEYCVSLIIVTLKRPSSIYFIPAGESALAKGLRFSLVSLLFGWWGVPWGPIYTIGALVSNFRGGKQVTSEVIASLERTDASQADEDNLAVAS